MGEGTGVGRKLLVLVGHLLLVVVLLGLGAVGRVLEGELRLRLINVLLLEVFVIVIENLVVHVEVLACVQGPALVTLVALRKLLLRRDVKVAGSDGELLHISLWVNVLYALINIINTPRVFLILAL